jgi:ribose 5-phosphate isomerase B
MRISIGSDHAGYDYKSLIISHIQSLGHTVTDHGTTDNSSVDYPDFVHPVAKDIIDSQADFGVLICGSGNGVSITANKYAEIRCGLCWNEELSKLARQHNNANVVAIPSRFVDIVTAKDMVTAFLETAFEGGRHERRVNKITEGLFSC